MSHNEAEMFASLLITKLVWKRNSLSAKKRYGLMTETNQTLPPGFGFFWADQVPKASEILPCDLELGISLCLIVDSGLMYSIRIKSMLT